MDDLEKFFGDCRFQIAQSYEWKDFFPSKNAEKLLAIAKLAVEQLEYLAEVHDCCACGTKDIAEGTLTQINNLVREK